MSEVSSKCSWNRIENCKEAVLFKNYELLEYDEMTYTLRWSDRSDRVAENVDLELV